MAKLNINGRTHDVKVEADTPLLWAIREQVGLTGTKYGCGIAQCGACTVHVDGEPVRSCSVPVGNVAGRKVTTIEGLMQTRTGKNPFGPHQMRLVDHLSIDADNTGIDESIRQKLLNIIDSDCGL